MVTRRLIPLVVAFALAFAPVALEACQASCLSHEGEAAVSGSSHHHRSHGIQAPAMPAGHAHHHAVDPAAHHAPGAAMVAQAHPCDHGDETPAFSASQNNTLTAPAITVSAFQFPAVQPRSFRALDATPALTPERIALTTQLRV